jgi:hypothetical protein
MIKRVGLGFAVLGFVLAFVFYLLFPVWQGNPAVLRAACPACSTFFGTEQPWRLYVFVFAPLNGFIFGLIGLLGGVAWKFATR